MTSEVFVYAGSVIIILWGIAHIIPTRQVVAGFGAISGDNRKIITMEWVVEGLALLFIGFLIIMVTWGGWTVRPDLSPGNPGIRSHAPPSRRIVRHDRSKDIHTPHEGLPIGKNHVCSIINCWNRHLIT